MSGSPTFRCQYVERFGRTVGLHPLVHGRFEIRRPSPLLPASSEFGPPTRFQLDTGAVETAVDDRFATLHGFGNYMLVGTPIQVEWFNASAAPLTAWRLYRWVRFRDYRDGLHGRSSDSGGIAHLEFRVAFIVVPNATIRLPLFGLRDMHNYFTLGSRENEYHFFARNSDGTYPSATDGGQGVREIP